MPTVRGAAVEDERHGEREVGEHVLGHRRADPPELVRRGRGHAAKAASTMFATEGREQRLRDRMRRHAQAHRVLSAGHRVEHVRRRA